MNLSLHKPLLYLITNRRAFLHNDNQLEAIRRAAQSGCQLIQVREKDLSPRTLCDFVREVIAAARPYGAKVLVNDRFDVALAARADGVHLRVNSLPVAAIRSATKERGLNDFLIGASTHSLLEARQAESDGADFVVFGPVYDTPSKREYGSPLGPDRLAEVCVAIKIPALAIGGISLINFRETLECGAAGIAAIGLFSNPIEIEDIMRKVFQE